MFLNGRPMNSGELFSPSTMIEEDNVHRNPVTFNFSIAITPACQGKTRNDDELESSCRFPILFFSQRKIKFLRKFFFQKTI